MKKVISIVLNHFTNDSRVLKEASSLQKNGYDVSVIALHKDGLAEKEAVQGFGVNRIKLITRNWPKRKPIQLLKLLEFALRVIVTYRKVDIIHCNDLAPLPIAIIMKWLSGGRIKVVYDAHEFETETVNTGKGLNYKFLNLLEGFFIKWVDSVITVSEGIAKEYAQRYQISQPALVLNCPNYKQVPKGNKFREGLGISNDKIIFLYQGALTRGRGLEILLQSFEQLEDENAVLVVMGYGPLEKLVKEAVKNSKNIFYHEAVSPKELLGYTASADFGISTIENLCLSYYYCLPNKLFEYAMAGLPIIVSNNPEMKKIVEDFHAGEVVQGENPDDVVNAVRRILKNDLDTYRENALKMAKDYCWERQEDTLLKVYKELK